MEKEGERLINHTDRSGRAPVSISFFCFSFSHVVRRVKNCLSMPLLQQCNLHQHSLFLLSSELELKRIHGHLNALRMIFHMQLYLFRNSIGLMKKVLQIKKSANFYLFPTCNFCFGVFLNDATQES